MTYRSFSTETWQDPWFERLSPTEKLLFIYFWTNDVCNQAGCYELSLRRVEFETGLKPEKIMQALSPKVAWFPDVEVVWVKTFFRRQCANEKFAIGAIRCLSSIPRQIVDQFSHFNSDLLEKYSIDTVSIPYKTENDTHAISVPDQIRSDTVPDTGSVSSSARQVGFEEFWKSYPKKVGKREALKAWIRLNGTRPQLQTIVDKIEELKKSSQWLDESGRYIPHPATWLNRGGWDDELRVFGNSEPDGPRGRILEAPDGA